MRRYTTICLLALFGSLLGSLALPASGQTGQEPPLSPSEQPDELQPPEATQPVPVMPLPRLLHQPELPLPPTIGSSCPVDPPPPVVTLRIRVAACAPSGQQLHYEITIENSSAAPAHHVLVRNPLPENAKFVKADPPPTNTSKELQWYLGTMPPCCCRVIRLTLEPEGAGDVKNCARVQYEHGQCVVTRVAQLGPPGTIPGVEPPPGKDKKPGAKPPTVKSGKIKLEITGPETYYLNMPVTYTLTLKNTGEAVARNAMIAADLPDKTQFVEASQGRKPIVNHLAWLVGDIEPGGQKTVTLTYKAIAAGKICLEAFAIANITETQTVEDSAQLCTFFSGESGLKLEMVDTKDPIFVGEETSYLITVTNQGGGPITQLTVTTTAPKELAVLRAKGPEKYQLGVSGDGLQVVNFAPVKTLASGKSAVFEVFVKAEKPGDVRFQVEIIADQLKKTGSVRETEGTAIRTDTVATEPIALQGVVEPMQIPLTTLGSPVIAGD